MEDIEIVELYWRRDEAAIAETADKYGRYLTKIAENILADRQDSEEGVNDAYLHAWNSMPPQRPSALSAYLAKLTRRAAIDIFRRRNREKRRLSEYAASLEELADCVSPEGTAEDALDAGLLAEAIGAFLRGQPEGVRSAFIGRYWFLDSVREVARYCGTSESAVKSTLYRTRRALRTYLQKEGFEL